MARKAKPIRRKPGTGTIRFKKGRELPWEAAFPLGHDQHRYSSFATRPEAEAYLDQLTEERDNKDIKRDIVKGSTRFDDFGSMWLGTKKGRVKDTTYNSYRYMLELAIGEWASRRMDEIYRPDADGLMSYFANRGFKNVKQMRGVLSQVFSYALEVNAIRKNPFAKVKPPTMEHRNPVALSFKQRTYMLEVAATTERKNLPLLPIWHLMSRVGLRRGEALGLRWQDIDFEEGTIHIVQQYVYLQGMKRSSPKTERSTRKIPAPADVFDLLLLHRDRQRIIRAHANTWEDHDLVFPLWDGTPLPVHYLHTAWRNLKKNASLPKDATIHGLRHTAEYLMEQENVPISSRMALLGHTTTTMATRYSDHADMDALRAATKKMG